MTVSAVTILVLSLIAAVVVAIGVWAYSTANRLDRLHVRSDLSWQALDAALARRAAVVRSIVASIPVPEGRTLALLADTAERADRARREEAENAVPWPSRSPRLPGLPGTNGSRSSIRESR